MSATAPNGERHPGGLGQSGGKNPSPRFTSALKMPEPVIGSRRGTPIAPLEQLTPGSCDKGRAAGLR